MSKALEVVVGGLDTGKLELENRIAWRLLTGPWLSQHPHLCSPFRQFVHIFDNDTAHMTAPNPRAGWEKVGDQFYRKIRLYESVFDPDLELENYLVAGASYGGAIGRWQ
jgi:hypothetical protein